MASYGSSDEEDDDFSPVIPSAVIAASAVNAAAASTPTPIGTDTSSPALKRERKDESGAHLTPKASSSAAAPPSPSSPSAALVGNAAQRAAETPEVAWERYRRQQLPCAPLYERSFLHTSLQNAHDAFAAAASAPAHTVSPVAAQTVHDMCVHLDSLGALVATIDAAGVVRVWRKLPSGLFFIAELDKVFLPARSVAAAGHERRTCHYWAHAYTALQMLVFVCTEEEEVEVDHGNVRRMESNDNGSSSSAPAVQAPLSTVRVHMRQVNPITLTVEERDSFTFQAPVQRVASAAATVADTAQRRNDEGARWTPRTSLAYTRRPAFLTHQYTPHIAFFVTLPATPGATGGGNGVVLCPCFASAMSAGSRSDHTAGAARSYVPARLSVANAIVACAQQGWELERTGTSACVVVDSAGVVDYCTIEAAAEAATTAATFPSTALGRRTLKVMAGLAAVPPTSREARVWRRWICFDRRQRTGFFSLIRDAQQALKARKEDENETAAGKAADAVAAADVQVLPAAVQLTPDGRHVLVWSFRFLRVAAASSQPASRIPSTERRYEVTVESCMHLLDFTAGVCIGRHTEPLGVFATSEDIVFGATAWADYVQLRGRALALRLHVEPSAAASNQFYVLVPELPLEQLLGVAAVSREAAEVAPAEVAGRVVHVYEVTLEAAAASSPSAAQSSATVRRLSHEPGEWEAIIRRGAEHPRHASHHDVGDVRKDRCYSGLATSQPTWGVLRLLSPNEYALTVNEESQARHEAHGCATATATAGVHPGLALCRAPLMLLRRAVTASQDLKNLVAASPVGAALGADARKHLFATPRAHVTTGGAASGEVLLLSSSADVSAAALLVYSSELPWGSAALGRVLSETAPPQTEEELTEEGRRLQEQLRQKSFVDALRELHRGRDDACGTLLLATVAPQSSSAAVALGGAGEAASTSPSATADVAGSTSGGGVPPGKTTEAAATTSVRVDAARRAATVTDEEAAVRALLKDLTPPLSASSPPVALVHVRGYGSIRVHLLPSIAPLATDNFVRLARRHYYDRLTFHRVIPAAIVQGGCPRGDGTGGESAFADGAPFSDEGLTLFPFFSHTANPLCCWLCMANAGPNTNGSQFFFTVPGGEAMPWLDGHHTVFGYAVEGLDVVRAMSMAARDDEDKPLSPIIMERVDVLSA
ncbi:Cyclophilin type peptidyl-prolyl cis-trans isomerase/CLD family protein [Leishmania donovani]|uniref:Cyclophilin type peptidyl-prolyl cis-trans isomerase/CLD family protein n=1 Tax=Leishmania donovani TaxID=5661 RepID=A0A504Y1D7_LEIDO|nr:Cyclophilin type peptidyl-prolyl cis-trans isomerase/CLD family protein [Leishmania donovani]